MANVLRLDFMVKEKAPKNYVIDEQIASFFNEDREIYNISPVNSAITFDDFLSDRMLIISAISKGIPFTLFELIRGLTPFSETDWADLLNISTKSLQRYKTDVRFKFKPIHSEKIIEIAEVTKLGLEVFGSMEKFRLWLNTPNFALGNKPPMDLIKNSYGKELVLTELHHINHGIFV
jgi:putative toxin-antitoxin system antitoxin component (TIGR02293 family)